LTSGNVETQVQPVDVFDTGTFETRVVEYREEMTELSTSLKQNMKNARRKIKEFLVESGLIG